ncbi:endonuclease/exonuclease/phosphatase family protein [Kurthia massiliensis]|uniref:endonuclease/exonuclease/phosphatase family protein n=1 Tax=Kurthia massiliensis TaxID=1033739 RepID=UPI00028893B5|nr:endonuclease/exonuclease/phosphatase family protein [Kurthia massiliensis]
MKRSILTASLLAASLLVSQNASAKTLQIHDIQAATHQSSYIGQKVEQVEGVVTFTYKLKGAYYFHMQTPDKKADHDDKTSEAITVYTGKNSYDVKVGDLVSVTGKVDEYYIEGYSDKQKTDLPVTQINARDDQGGAVVIQQENVALPKAINITKKTLPKVIDNDQFTKFDPKEDAIDYWESLESMRVSVKNVRATGPQEYGDVITVLQSTKADTKNGGVLFGENDPNAERVQFKLFGDQATKYDVNTGDLFNGAITGVVGYGYANYKIFTSVDDMKQAYEKGQATPETTSLKQKSNRVTVGSFNLENFSNNPSETSDAKAMKLATSIAKSLNSPDIVGVTEVQDNNGSKAGDSRANESYERLIKAIEQAGGPAYQYVNIDPENNGDGGAPNANIRVGFLYNPARVSLQAGQAGDATTAVQYDKKKGLNVNPGRIDPTNKAFENSRKPLAAAFTFQGKELIAIVNHWNSKSGDTPLFGQVQPVNLASEVQRQQIANVVGGFVQDVLKKNPKANIVSVGDYNDFQFSKPLQTFERSGMKNLIQKVPKKERYTYVYQGNSQVLDHILVSKRLASSAKIDVVHVNADFTEQSGRASDHDPVLAQLKLK